MLQQKNVVDQEISSYGQWTIQGFQLDLLILSHSLVCAQIKLQSLQQMYKPKASEPDQGGSVLLGLLQHAWDALPGEVHHVSDKFYPWL